MARKSWVQHPITGELIPAEEYVRPSTRAHYVIGDDMPATRSMADGQIYTSKSKFREATRRAGCVEVGNESNAVFNAKKREAPSPKQAIIDACDRAGVRY